VNIAIIGSSIGQTDNMENERVNILYQKMVFSERMRVISMKGDKPKHSENHSHQEQDIIVLPTLFPPPQSFKSKNNQEQACLLGTTEGLTKSLELAHLGSWEWDIPAHKITWSPELYRIYDIDPQVQLNYGELMERVHPEDRDYYKTVVRDWTKNRQGSSFEYRILCSDGSIRFVHGETEVFCDDAGNPNRIFGVIQDITERKQTEEELGKHRHHLELLVREWTTEFTKTNDKLAKEIIRREHVEDKLLKEKKFSETAINSLPGIFYLLDEQGRIIRYNRNAEKVTGYSGEEFINLTAFDLVAEEDRETMAEKMREVFTSGEATMEAGLLTKDKKKISYFFTGSKMNIDNKKYIVGMGIDLTQHKRMEESLRESEEKLRSMFDHMQDISYRTDKEGKVIWISPSATRILGYESTDELLGRNLAKDLYTSPEQRQIFLKKLSEEGMVNDYEVELNKKDGGTIIVSTNSHYYRDKEGEIAGVEGVCRDVTERKRAEDELRARQKEIEKLNATLEARVQEEVEKSRQKDYLMIQQSRLAAMGEMIRYITHQWGQPLWALQLLFHNLEDSIESSEIKLGDSNELIANGFALIKRMFTTMDDFKNFFQADKEKVVFSINKTIKDILSLIGASFKYSDIPINLDEKEELMASGFPNEFSQVALNILKNAKDAILEKGIKGVIKIDFLRDDDSAIVRIRDNGGGIPEDIIDKIFDSYFTTKKDGTGTGIGLYLSKVIIEDRMNGRINVRNINNGAEFEIILPLTQSS